MTPFASSLFGSFWMGGFECSSHRRPSGRRIDVIDATGHDRYAAQDYARLAAAGLHTARDGLRWHLIERTPGEYDFFSLRSQLAAASKAGVEVIWDLMHYGWPDAVDVFAPDFPEVFARYARAAVTELRANMPGELWLCPINEISFLAWGGGEVAYLNPFDIGRGEALKAQLVRAAILAMNAAREIDPGVRFIHAEPLISVTHHPDKPHDAHEAARQHDTQYQALDMLAGRSHPELGGSPAHLDVLGVNYYPYNQWWHHAQTVQQTEEREPLPPGHPEQRPLRDLLAEIAERYRRPLLISETGTEGGARAGWLTMVAGEVGAARATGVPVEGVCLYPVVNHPGWDDDRHCHNGLWDYPDVQGHREADPALAAALAQLQVEVPPAPRPQVREKAEVG